MTSNLATEEITSLCRENENIEMQELVNAINPTLSSYLKPALLGRMNVIPFMNLSDVSLKEIVKLKLGFIEKQLMAKEVKFKYEEKVLDRIVFLSNAMDTGARNIDLIINTNIMPVLSRTILDCTIEQSLLRAVKLDLDSENKITVKSTLGISKNTEKPTTKKEIK